MFYKDHGNTKLTDDKKLFIINRLYPLVKTLENNRLLEYKIYGLAKSYMKDFQKEDVLVIYNILRDKYNEYINELIASI